MILLIVAFFNPSNAQQALFGGQDIVSPEINTNNSVTFRLNAPNAKEVLITGDFLPTQKIDSPMGQMDAPGKVALTKNDKGIWAFTSEPLNSELYSYSFIVDGFSTTDPNNPFLIREWRTGRFVQSKRHTARNCCPPLVRFPRFENGSSVNDIYTSGL